MNKRLFLLRHAKSSRDDPARADLDRPLAPRGRRAAKAIRGHLQREGISPDLVLCSPAARTRQTLELIRAGFGDGPDVRIEERLYHGSAGDLLEMLRTVAAEVDSVMLIGHNPAMQQLALSLAGDGVRVEELAAKFPTAALATLALQGGWVELTPGSAILASVVRPRELKDVKD